MSGKINPIFENYLIEKHKYTKPYRILMVDSINLNTGTNK